MHKTQFNNTKLTHENKIISIIIRVYSCNLNEYILFIEL